MRSFLEITMDVMILATRDCTHRKDLEKELKYLRIPYRVRRRLRRPCPKVRYPAFAEFGGGRRGRVPQTANGSGAASLFHHQDISPALRPAKPGLSSIEFQARPLDTLEFADGVGENAPVTRVRICASMWLHGIKIEEKMRWKRGREICSGRTCFAASMLKIKR